MGENDRKRAWMLVKTDTQKANSIANKILAKSHKETGNLVIRADEVAGAYNLVLSVDLSEGSIEGLKGQLLEFGAESVEVLRIVKHNPFPPHRATGFITPAEKKAKNPPKVDVGIQGFNAWG